MESVSKDSALFKEIEEHLDVVKLLQDFLGSGKPNLENERFVFGAKHLEGFRRFTSGVKEVHSCRVAHLGVLRNIALVSCSGSLEIQVVKAFFAVEALVHLLRFLTVPRTLQYFLLWSTLISFLHHLLDKEVVHKLLDNTPRHV